MNYSSLDSARICGTITKLVERIDERFPDCGLAMVGRELAQIAADTSQQVAEIARPNWLLRGVAAVIVLSILGVSLVVPFMLKPPADGVELDEFVQLLESLLNDALLIGAAVFFLVSLETRLKRRRALAVIHQLRAAAHIIDMHQLTKDPERYSSAMVETQSSPKRSMSLFELGRYLDYCSELLSLNGKIAALYVQGFQDAVVIAAVNEIENLCTGLSRKIWQKIMILQTLRDE